MSISKKDEKWLPDMELEEKARPATKDIQLISEEDALASSGYTVNVNKWQALAPLKGNQAAKWVDDNMGSAFVSQSVHELKEKSGLTLEEWLDFYSIKAVKTEIADIQNKLNSINTASLITKELESGASLHQIKSAQSLLNDDEENSTIFVYGYVESLNNPVEKILHTCPGCSMEFYG